MSRQNVQSRPVPPLPSDPAHAMLAVGNNNSNNARPSHAPPRSHAHSHSHSSVNPEALSDVAKRDLRFLSEHAVPPDADQQNRRKLLLIFIHGFLGDETSFQGFPAHLHNILTILLAESHSVHSKIYPRYRSRRNISFARDDFSHWLEPHENETTDIILLGHSMGGLLAADIVLMPSGQSSIRPFKHHILGTVNFDVPFLGMHPGVVKSGLASIFRPADPVNESDDASGRSSIGDRDQPRSSRDSLFKGALETLESLSSPSTTDPNFNPSFNNDVNLPVRKGWRNALHFITKHRHNLPKAAKQLVSSHLEFGGALANYGELKTRYRKIRALEEDDWRSRKAIIGDETLPSRVRFVNYYTVCTGRPKKSDSSHSQHLHRVPTLTVEIPVRDPVQSPVQEAQSPLEGVPEEDTGTSTLQLPPSDPQPRSPLAIPRTVGARPLSTVSTIRSTGARPLSTVSLDRTATKYFDAMETLSFRDDGSSTPQDPLNEQNSPSVEDGPKPVKGVMNSIDGQMQSDESTTSIQTTVSRRERTFCLLPPTDSQGHTDPCWARVFMENVDEVGAHCGLFLVDEKYERLVGEVASRVEAWVAEALDMDLSHLIGT